MAAPPKGPADDLMLGDYNAVCSMSGFKRKASKLVKNWQGYYRIPAFNEPRQPQDFVRGEPDVQTVPWAQPPTSVFVEICTYNGLSAIPDFSLPGCMVPGRTQVQDDFNPLNPIFPPPPVTASLWITEGGDFWVTENGDDWSIV
jgi:hypothetical protein